MRKIIFVLFCVFVCPDLVLSQIALASIGPLVYNTASPNRINKLWRTTE